MRDDDSFRLFHADDVECVLAIAVALIGIFWPYIR
jgi:hypothetical protein